MLFSLELFVVLSAVGWKLKNFIAPALIFFYSFVIGTVLFAGPPLGGVLFLVIMAYQIVSHIRLVQGRLNPHYQKKVASRTSVLLIFAQLVLILIFSTTPIDYQIAVNVIALLQLLTAVLLLLAVIASIRKSRFVLAANQPKSMPTITVAIPARNETAALNACLESWLASNYPRLEILVLDDCSLDQTPQVIKSFAQKGVRFLQGTSPKKGWLAKNQACEALAKEASGDFILFCGVDLRVSPESLGRLVEKIMEDEVSVVSVLPVALPSKKHSGFLPWTLRQWWKFSSLNNLGSGSPVISSCWIIGKDNYKKTGGFASVAGSIRPEAYFASYAARLGKYRLYRANSLLDIAVAREFKEEWEAAVRVKYPEARRKIERVLILSVRNLALLLGPYVLLGLSIANQLLPIALLSGLSIVLNTTSYSLVVHISSRNNRLINLLGFPLAVLMDIGLLHYSMFKYEFSEVLWKGRNICLPVMSTILKLPNLKV